MSCFQCPFHLLKSPGDCRGQILVGVAVRGAGLALGRVSSAAQSLVFGSAHLRRAGLLPHPSPVRGKFCHMHLGIFPLAVCPWHPPPSLAFLRRGGSRQGRRLSFELTWMGCAGLQTRYGASAFTGSKVAGSWSGKSFKNKTKIKTFLQ